MIHDFRLIRATKVGNLTLRSNSEGLGTEAPKKSGRALEQVDFIGKKGVSVPEKKMAHRGRGKAKVEA